jgi:hypothetical protein
MALPNLWGLYNLRSSPYFQATLRSDSQATPLTQQSIRVRFHPDPRDWPLQQTSPPNP